MTNNPIQFNNFLKKSTELVLVNRLNNPNNFILLSRQQSKPQPLGRCRSGSEDYLLLINITNGAAKLKDKLLLQSCEQNTYLDIDDPYSTQEIISDITFNADKTTLNYLMRKFDGNNFISIKQTVSISDNKFTINQ